MKSSSRAGRFKKKLVSQENLLTEAPLIHKRLYPLLELWQRNQLKAPEFTALYLLAILSIRHPAQCLGARRPKLSYRHGMDFKLKDIPWDWEPNVARRLGELTALGEIFQHFALKATPEAVNRSLLQWSTGNYPLELLFHIPAPAEVLKQQCRGSRCVTVLTRIQELERLVLGERDCLSFSMHDLIHADHFFHDNACREGQLGFYGLLARGLTRGDFDQHLADAGFAREFEYLISDMNAYAVHLMKCLKSALLHYAPQSWKFEHWLAVIGATQEAAMALQQLNQSDYSPLEQDAAILSFLHTQREIFSEKCHLP